MVDVEARKMYDFFVKISEDRFNDHAHVKKWGRLNSFHNQMLNVEKMWLNSLMHL